MVASCDLDGSPSDDRGGMDREFGRRLRWRGGGKGSRIRVGVAGGAGTQPARANASAQGDRLPVLAGGTLIARLEVDSLIGRDLRARARLGREFPAPLRAGDRSCPRIRPVAARVRVAPSCATGGMAVHSLETALHALKRRQGLMLPPGAPTETQQRA